MRHWWRSCPRLRGRNHPWWQGWWEPGEFTLADPLVTLQLAEQGTEVNILVDMGASYSAKWRSITRRCWYCNSSRSYWPTRKGCSLKPIKYRLGKQAGMHKSLYKPGCLTSLLRWDLLEQQNAEVKHKKGKLERGVKEDQLIEILSLALTDWEEQCDIPRNYGNPDWGTCRSVGVRDAQQGQQCSPDKLKAWASPVGVKQYLLRIQDHKGIKVIMDNILEFGPVIECESDSNIPVLPV